MPAASYPILVLSGIIGLLPGLGLLVAMQELGTGNLVSGTARMAGTGLVFVLLAFGVSQIVASLPIIPGCLGIVEGSLAVILVAYGAQKVPALAVVLVYRLLTFWLVIVVGWISIGVIEWRVRHGVNAEPLETSALSATEN